MTSDVNDTTGTTDTTAAVGMPDTTAAVGTTGTTAAVGTTGTTAAADTTDTTAASDAAAGGGDAAAADATAAAAVALAMAAARRPGFRDQPLVWLVQTIGQSVTRLTTHAIALYGTAVLRIGYGSLYLIFLLHEYPKHESLWGPNAPWTPALNQQFANDPGLDWFAVDRWWYTFLGHGGNVWFQFWYHAAILICLLMLLGWRTRATSVCFALTIMAFTGRDVFLTDGGDNVMGLMAIYLAFSRCGAVWSLDSRRRRRQAEKRRARGIPEFTWPDSPGWQAVGELDRTREEIVTFLHNAAVLVIAAQACVVYAAAGLYKSQGSYWQNGTALYYTLHLDWFRPWPGLSNFMAGQSVTIAIVAYLTVFVQIAFPFAVFSKWLKYPCLVALVGMHFSIAVVMGLPLFSAAMMVADAVFLPEAVWRWVGRKVGAGVARLPRPGLPRPAPSTPRSPEASVLPRQAQPHKSASH
ncbi:HTTM domain-containing protein [Catenulispora sp. NL8]|uniref:HTTM domain-containing protein n=1 Tax=Catenulispora pinistramenti TaxID=2705254 RepID=A0ABS5KQE6_9ACTN|nr:HTTM domain-containing protein [Catenulispora pinistramenti]MBS2548230.1 HTTM domain-containing protein [Catenulispora pinistramenti]